MSPVWTIDALLEGLKAFSVIKRYFKPTNRVGPKKYQKIARMYDCTGLSTKCTLIKTGFKSLRTGTDAKIRSFVDALLLTHYYHITYINIEAFLSSSSLKYWPSK